MKTETQIRRHLANLRFALASSCDCAASGHAQQCRRYEIEIVAAVRYLSWVLGEDEALQRNLEILDRAIASRIAANN